MIAPIEIAAVQSATSEAAVQPLRREVNIGEVERFEAAMRGDGVSGQYMEVVVQQPVSATDSVAGAMLDAVHDFRQNQMEHVGKIAEMTSAGPEKGPMEMRDLFSLQMELMQLSFQQDLAAKVADKMSQGIQTLFRNQ